MVAGSSGRGSGRASISGRSTGGTFLPSAIAEVYLSVWSRSFTSEDRTADQHDAFSVARWLSGAELGRRHGPTPEARPEPV